MILCMLFKSILCWFVKVVCDEFKYVIVGDFEGIGESCDMILYSRVVIVNIDKWNHLIVM